MQKYITQFNNKTSAIIGDNTEKTAFLSLLTLLAVSFALYLFFVGSTILNIVERKNLENNNRILNSKVSELELKYLSETSKIDLNLAYSLGFKDAVGTAFASNNASSKGLSFAKNN